NDLSLIGAVPMYYDKQGFPIPAEPDAHADEPGWFLPALKWAELHSDITYRRVAYDDLPDGSYLSTAWLGLDHHQGRGPPLIFETMRCSGDESEMTMPAVSIETRTVSGEELIPPIVPHGLTYHESLEFPDIFTDGETTEQLRYTTEEEAL